jgi:Cu-Zn family superoxide dismutase
MKNFKYISAFVLLLTVGCSSANKASTGSEKSAPVYYAVAVMNPTEGNTVSGQVHFSEGFGEVKVVAKLKGLPPNSEHGFHIHEFGDCRAANASSAGGHYNPKAHAHGAPNSEAHHAGDLGNIKSNAKGEATLKLEMRNISLSGSMSPILGRGMIVHKNPDDLVSQPTGGAGDRIACGIIGAVEKL